MLSSHFRVLVTGVTSIHGWPVFRLLRSILPESNVFGIRSPKMREPKGDNVIGACITDVDELARVRDSFQPTHVVHCAGVCDLDVCEDRPHWAHLMNTVGTRTVAEVFGKHSYIVYLSSDLVFSGNGAPDGGYAEEHGVDPVSVAGHTIANAERELQSLDRFCVVRLGLPIGASVNLDKGAVDFIAGRFRRGLPVTLFWDELRSCIDCDEIAKAVAGVLARELVGVYHCGGTVPMSLYGIGKWVLDQGCYERSLLKGIYRSQERNGPPRMGNVALNSSKLAAILGHSSFGAPVPEKFRCCEPALRETLRQI